MDLFKKIALDLDKERIAAEIPCAGIGIFLDGKTQIAVCGSVNVDSPDKADTDQIFHMGSCSKAVTALLIHFLAEQKYFSLNQTLADLLPDIEVDESYRNVSLDDVLMHAAGLPRDPDLLEADFDDTDLQSVARRRKEILSQILSSPAPEKVGVFSYSNTGYILLATIVSEKTGEFYETLVQRNIFDIYDMHSASFFFMAPEKPWGHAKESGKLKAVCHDNPPIYNPAGCIVSNLADWLKFLNGTLCYQAGKDINGVPADEEGKTYLNYAFSRKSGVLRHWGSNLLNFSCNKLDPVSGLCAISVVNEGSEQADNLVTDFTERLLALAEKR